jgi:hypothetical protein
MSAGRFLFLLLGHYISSTKQFLRRCHFRTARKLFSYLPVQQIDSTNGAQKKEQTASAELLCAHVKLKL